MLALFQAHAKFVAAVRPSLDHAEFAKVSEEHAVQIVDGFAKLGSNELLLADATAIVSATPDTAFDEKSKRLIVTTTSGLATELGKNGAVPAQLRSAAQPQEHLFLHRYLTEPEWTALLNATWSLDGKVPILINRSKAIGLFNCTEKTSLSVTALLILAHGKGIDNVGAFELLHSVKSAYGRMRQHKGSMGQTLQKFPAEANLGSGVKFGMLSRPFLQCLSRTWSVADGVSMLGQLVSRTRSPCGISAGGR